MANTIIMKNKTTTGAGGWVKAAADIGRGISFQAVIEGTGAVTSTVDIEVSNDGVNAIDTVAGTISLSGTTTHNDGFTADAPWAYWRANITAISGTSAAVTVIANGAVASI
jgi:hypothetical protein